MNKPQAIVRAEYYGKENPDASNSGYYRSDLHWKFEPNRDLATPMSWKDAVKVCNRLKRIVPPSEFVIFTPEWL